MPVTTPSIKIDAVRSLGGEVILHGDTYDDAYTRARELEQEHSLTFIHPLNDPAVIAGQGTIGRELLQQLEEDVQAIFVPIGGGLIFGIEPEDSAAMRDSLAAGEVITLDYVDIFADGVAVRRVGDETFRMCQELVDEIVTVDTDQICAGIRDIFEDTRSIVEPAGALAIAGVKKYIAANHIVGAAFVVINCGANVNFDRLRHIAE